MKRICIQIKTLEPGGIERYVLRFLEYSDRDYDIFLLSSCTGALLSEYEKRNVKLIPFRLGYFNFFSWIRLFIFFKKYKFDSFCSFLADFAGIPIFIAKLAGITNRVTFYRSSSNHYKPNILKKIYNKSINRLVYVYSSFILSNSSYAIDFFFPYKKKEDSRFYVVRNGIDIRPFLIQYDKKELRKEMNLPIDKLIIGHTGRYNFAKNFPMMINVVKYLTLNNDNIHFVFCGRNTDSKELLDLIKQEKISDYITVLGFRNDVHRVLKTFDIYYFPSITEGQPNSLLEAMISGLPLVSSNIQPIVESVPKEAICWLADPMSLEDNVLKLESMIKFEERPSYKDWAIANYDSKKQFDLFKNFL